MENTKAAVNGGCTSPSFRHHLPQVANLTRNSKIAQSKAGAKVEPVKDEATLVVEDTGKVVKIEIMENASGSSNYDHAHSFVKFFVTKKSLLCTVPQTWILVGFLYFHFERKSKFRICVITFYVIILISHCIEFSEMMLVIVHVYAI